jgi:pimeloyl-ACP methyl ester carboxylesterase
MRRVLLAMCVMASVLGGPASSAGAAVESEPVTFEVTNPADPLARLQVAGTIYRPEGCISSVMLLVHGLSYGQWAWDFPVGAERYSVARDLAEAGYAAVAVDLPGYGESSKPNGYTLTVEGYADMVGQMAGALREAGFGKVGLMGHSAGTEISELAAAAGTPDLLVATGYTHFPSQRIVTDFITGDMTRAATSDYEYFGGTPEQRLEYMYAPDGAEAEVMAEDNRLANLTPSGEIYSIGPQPSRAVQGLIDVPVLLVLAEHDLLFPVADAETELAMFVGTSDKELHIVEGAGHSFMLHRGAAQTNAVVAGWLGRHAPDFPACA